MPTKRAAATVHGAAAKRCIDFFYEQYVRHFNPPETADPWMADRSVPKAQMVLPVISGGKDAALMLKLVAAWDEEVVLGVIADFFGDAADDPRVFRSNRDIAAFYSLAQYVMLRRQRPADDRTAQNVAAARRATQRRG